MKLKFLLWLLKFATSRLYNHIDKNKDGKLDKQELQGVINILNNLKDRFKNGKN